MLQEGIPCNLGHDVTQFLHCMEYVLQKEYQSGCQMKRKEIQRHELYYPDDKDEEEDGKDIEEDKSGVIK